jgi:hypothetical protein
MRTLLEILLKHCSHLNYIKTLFQTKNKKYLITQICQQTLLEYQVNDKFVISYLIKILG